jgi:hypothetical protein
MAAARRRDCHQVLLHWPSGPGAGMTRPLAAFALAVPASYPQQGQLANGPDMPPVLAPLHRDSESTLL